MKIKICILGILTVVMIGVLCGCGASADASELSDKEMAASVNPNGSTYAEMDSGKYTVNEDGTYTCRGYNFKYKMTVSGQEGEAYTTFTILTNDPETTFEEVRYSLISNESCATPPEGPKFIIVSLFY